MLKSSNLIRLTPLLIILFVSAAALIQPDRKLSKLENRKLKTFSKINFNIKNFHNIPSEIDDYVKDQAFLKDSLFSLYSRFKLSIGDSPSQDVTIGKDGWLYLGSPYSQKHPDLIGLSNKIIPQPKPDAYIQQKEQFKSYLSSQEIKYLFVIAPDKPTIYPEYLPERYQNYQKKRSLFSENVSNQLSKALGESFIYLRDPLLNAKKSIKSNLLYYRWDTHWNMVGANVAEAFIATRIASMFPALNLGSDPFAQKLVSKNSYLGDLAGFAGATFLLDDHLAPTCHANAIRKKGVSCINQKRPLKILLLGDSFSGFLQQYLSRRYSEIILVTERPNLERLKELVANTKPDLVIEEIVERTFRIFSNQESF